ncbi:hypothetical protein F5883DRAFT_440390 [Diaporthe sp. PMI_573]|nr:hypothetical protein F5883DRAFT_440390 [Diaporthaceae sp. PMI_573]
MNKPCRSGRDTKSTSLKRSSSYVDGNLPRKKSCLSAGSSPPSSSAGQASVDGSDGSRSSSNLRLDRIHRRVVLRDYGSPIHTATSHVVLLRALAECIQGHESLFYKAGLLHRDISINNLMINNSNNNNNEVAAAGDDDEFRASFLIDLDLAVRTDRLGASGARGKTGTLAFMAIDALRGEPHTFMADLESFFWVLVVYQLQGAEPASN